MKKSKFLLLAPCVALATTMPIVSCGQQSWTTEKIIDAIFKPIQLNPVETDGDVFMQLKTLSKEDLQAELLYDLYGNANEPLIDTNDKTIKQLYDEGFVSITPNIKKCSLEFNDNNLIANFVGYIQITFIKDCSETWKKGDWEIMTYKLINLPVQLDEENPFALLYIDGDPHFTNISIGFTEIKWCGGEEHLYNIRWINTQDYSLYNLPTNSHNWIKKVG